MVYLGRIICQNHGIRTNYAHWIPLDRWRRSTVMEMLGGDPCPPLITINWRPVIRSSAAKRFSAKRGPSRFEDFSTPLIADTCSNCLEQSNAQPRNAQENNWDSTADAILLSCLRQLILRDSLLQQWIGWVVEMRDFVRIGSLVILGEIKFLHVGIFFGDCCSKNHFYEWWMEWCKFMVLERETSTGNNSDNIYICLISIYFMEIFISRYKFPRKCRYYFVEISFYSQFL